jgi:RimJ/RimL family protein N-acetyltransferase
VTTQAALTVHHVQTEHEVTAELVDGTEVVLRQLTPGDGDKVVRLYENLSEDERYYRFFRAHSAHLRRSALSLTESPQKQYTVGAFHDGELLGVASYFKQDPDQAEIAVVVAHDQHLRGVGTVLLRRLGAIARDNGVHRFVAEVLAENRLMLQLLTDLGWHCSRHLDGAVLYIVVDLDSV